MDSRVSVGKAANGSNLKVESDILELFLHLSLREHTEIAVSGGRAAFGEFLGDSVPVFFSLDLFLEGGNVGDGFLLGAGDGLFTVGIVGVAGSNVLLQNM